MRNTFLLLVGALVAAGLMAAVPSPAQAGDGCVSISEARDTLGNDVGQRQGEIEQGFGATPEEKYRQRGALWASYRPCLRPDADQSYVHVIYYRTATGNWKTIYWNWSLYRPGYFRAVTDESTDHLS